MERLKQAIWPFIAGAVVGMLVMPFVFGFVTSGTADAMANDAREKAEETAAAMLVPHYVPACVENAQADQEALAAVQDASSYRRRGVVEDAGLATYPDGANEDLVRAINEGCADEIAALSN